MFNIMHTSDDLTEAIKKSEEHPIVLFKHSATCPFSAAAQVEVANAKHDVDVYGLVIQYARELSAEVAERLDTEHRSPQALIVHKGKVVGDYWRSQIKEDTLKQEVAALA